MKIYTTLFALLVLIAVPIDALACACCAERGFYYSGESKIQDFQKTEIDKLLPATSNLYTDVGYPETVKGLGSESMDFKVESPFGGGLFELRFTDDKGKNGTIKLTRPTTMHRLMFDSDPLADSGPVILTKQFRMKGRVKSVDGFLTAGESYDMTYDLVLNGKGNGCTNAGDFESYFVRIEGLKAGYRFFGKLRVSEDRAMQKRGDKSGTVVPNVSSIP